MFFFILYKVFHINLNLSLSKEVTIPQERVDEIFDGAADFKQLGIEQIEAREEKVKNKSFVNLYRNEDSRICSSESYGFHDHISVAFLMFCPRISGNEGSYIFIENLLNFHSTMSRQHDIDFVHLIFFLIFHDD